MTDALATMQTVVPSSGGLSVGEWLAIIGCAATLLGITYKTGATVANGEAVEKRMEEKHDELRESLDGKMKAIMDSMTRIEAFVVVTSTWRAEITRDVLDLQVDMENVRERTHDTNDALTPLYVELKLPLPERRHRPDRRAS